MNPFITTPSPPLPAPAGVELHLCTLLADMDGLAEGKAMLAAHQLDRQATDNVVGRMRADIAARQTYGRAKYPADLIDNPAPFRERIDHAYQEALDLAVYLTWALIFLGQCRHLLQWRIYIQRMQTQAMHSAIDLRVLLDLFSAPNSTEPPPP